VIRIAKNPVPKATFKELIDRKWKKGVIIDFPGVTTLRAEEALPEAARQMSARG
jgi:hypothetical protein